jgi:hypothetical protein
LINAGLRTDANIIVETALARDPHQFAVILGLVQLRFIHIWLMM